MLYDLISSNYRFSMSHDRLFVVIYTHCMYITTKSLDTKLNVAMDARYCNSLKGVQTVVGS